VHRQTRLPVLAVTPKRCLVYGQSENATSPRSEAEERLVSNVFSSFAVSISLFICYIFIEALISRKAHDLKINSVGSQANRKGIQFQKRSQISSPPGPQIPPQLWKRLCLSIRTIPCLFSSSSIDLIDLFFPHERSGMRRDRVRERERERRRIRIGRGIPRPPLASQNLFLPDFLAGSGFVRACTCFRFAVRSSLFLQQCVFFFFFPFFFFFFFFFFPCFFF